MDKIADRVDDKDQQTEGSDKVSAETLYEKITNYNRCYLPTGKLNDSPYETYIIMKTLTYLSIAMDGCSKSLICYY